MEITGEVVNTPKNLKSNRTTSDESAYQIAQELDINDKTFADSDFALPI